MLYRNGLIMYDRQTNSLWSHILGKAVAGELEGTQLTFITALQTNWQTWQALHPETLVINPGLFGGDSYRRYYTSSRAGVLGWSNPNDLLHSKEYVIGVRLSDQAKAYPFSILSEMPIVNDEVAGVPIAVFFDKRSASGAVFDRRLPEAILTFEPAQTSQVVRDTATQSEWNIFSGVAVSGPLKGTQLSQIPITYAFWFGWVDYHSEATVYGLN